MTQKNGNGTRKPRYLRLSDAVWNELQNLATRNRRSIAAETEIAIEEYVARQNKRK